MSYTITNSSLTTASDEELVNNIKNGIDESDSAEILKERHSGIYVKVVKKHIPQTCPFIDINELISNNLLFIYEVALDYDKGRGAKFPTYLGHRTKWECLGLQNEAKKRPEYFFDSKVLNFVGDLSVIEGMGAEKEKYDDENVAQVVRGLIETIKEKNKDMYDVLKIRYYPDSGDKLVPYHEIGRRLGFTYEWSRQLHDKGIEILREGFQKTEKNNFFS